MISLRQCTKSLLGKCTGRAVKVFDDFDGRRNLGLGQHAYHELMFDDPAVPPVAPHEYQRRTGRWPAPRFVENPTNRLFGTKHVAAETAPILTMRDK